jgi:hypothetical protein
MERLLNVISLLSAGLIVMVLISLRRAHIRVEHSVSWLVAGIVMLLLSRSHAILDSAADWMGITYAPLALVIIAFSVFLLVFYHNSRVISDLKDANTALAQRVAILEFRLLSLTNEEQTTVSR